MSGVASGAPSGVSGAAGLRARPNSARGRLVREVAREPPPSLVHRCNEPPPDAAGAGLQGPGHYRHFDSASRAVVQESRQDPLRQGDQIERDLHFYSMPRKCTCQGRECAPMRTLDVARINKDRHNWQRIDTFQTPYGNGHASWDGSQNRTRTSSRERARGVSTQALAGLGLEIEDLRTEFRSGLAGTKEDLSQTIATAVNQIISELREDVRAEIRACVRACKEMTAPEEAKQSPRSEPVAIATEERPDSPMPTALLTELCQQVLQACQMMCEEVQKNGRSGQDEREALRELREVPQCFAQLWSRLDQHHTEVLQSLKEMDLGKLTKLTEDCRGQLQAVAADSRALQATLETALEATKKAAAPGADKVTVDAAPILEPLQQLVDAVDARSARVLDEIRQLRGQETAQADPREHFRECLAETGLAQSLATVRKDLLESVGEVKVKLQELDQLGALKDVKQWQATSDSALKALREDLAREREDRGERERAERSERRKESLTPATVDLSPILQALESEHLSLKEAIRQHSDASPVLTSLEQVRKGLANMSQEVEISRAEVVKRSDVTSLSHIMNNAWEVLAQMGASLNKVDFGFLQADVQRVAEEIRNVRAEDVPKITRAVQEVDLSPILQGLKDRRQQTEELGEALREEMHKLRRDCDFTEVIQRLEQVEPNKLLRAIRECKVSPDDLAPVLDEVRRLSEELRQSRSNREVLQLMDEVGSVKTELRQGHRDVSQALASLKEGHLEHERQISTELKTVKGMLATDADAQQGGLSGEAVVRAVQEAVEEMRHVASSVTSSVLEAVDLSPMIAEIQAVRNKVEVSSALKRQGETMTKSDFAVALEELRGHFSLLLNSFREVNDAGASRQGCEQNLLQNLLDQRKVESSCAEDLLSLRQKLRESQARDAMRPPPRTSERNQAYEPVTRDWEPVAREPAAREPTTHEANAAPSFANVSFQFRG